MSSSRSRMAEIVGRIDSDKSLLRNPAASSATMRSAFRQHGAALLTLVHGIAKIVEVVGGHSLQSTNIGSPRCGERPESTTTMCPVFTLAHHDFQFLSRQQHPLRGGGDHRVGPQNLFPETFGMDRLDFALPGQLLGMIPAAIDHGNLTGFRDSEIRAPLPKPSVLHPEQRCAADADRREIRGRRQPPLPLRLSFSRQHPSSWRTRPATLNALAISESRKRPVVLARLRQLPGG